MTVVVRDGQLRQLGRKSWPFAGSQNGRVVKSSTSLYAEGMLNADYSRIYASQPYIYALVNKLARGVARLPLKQYGRQASDARERLDPAHPLRTLIERPYPRGSRFSLIEATVGNLAVYGQGAWWKFRPGPGQAPVELWPLDWRYMTFQTGPDVPVDHYEYRGPAGRKLFLVDDIVHFRWWSPAGDRGTSPLEALRDTLILESAGRRFAISSFAHGVRPSGAIVTEKTLDKEQKDELRAELESYNAGPDNAFRVALLDGGLDWKPFGGTAEEAQTIEHRKLNHEEACAVYDIPPPVVHILDRATFSNVSEQNKALYRESLGPWLTMIDETIEAQLLVDEPAFIGTFVEFDLDEVLKADIAVRAAAYRSMETTLSMNERRRLENLPPIGDPGDEANPANAVLVAGNMAMILPNGDVVNPLAADTGSPLASALSAELETIVDRVVAERVAALELEPR